MFNPELANTLPNGAKILDRRQIGEYWVWFAEFHGPQPYVTWVSNVSSPGETYWGHYHTLFLKGYDEFCERIREEWLSNGYGSVS
jgi:hypothetical protein